MTTPKQDTDLTKGRGRRAVETQPGVHHETGEPLPACQLCGRTMRPCRTTITDYPNTVPRTNFKVCSTCGHQPGYAVKRGERIARNLVTDSAEGLVVQERNTALEYWLKNRRLRLLEQKFSVSRHPLAPSDFERVQRSILDALTQAGGPGRRSNNDEPTR